ncbi:hypothetical protein [Mycolicibacterium sp.]|uniref:hypothetical protein n=1 Tax=Mycolicibacterium sp. TaxID=2320850 RepID=UPI0037C9D3B6
MTRRVGDEAKRLGRAVVFVHQHESQITQPHLRAEIETLLLTGRAMDFAARIKGHGELVVLTHDLIHQYAKYAGLGNRELNDTVLPKLKAADLIDYRRDGQGRIVAMEEFVGVSAAVIEQTVTLLNSLSPSRTDLAVLHSVEIGAIAPLAESQHLEQVVQRGFTDQEAHRALTMTRAIGINLAVESKELNEQVIFSPYVWGTKQLSLAKFLAGLPPNERDALLGMSEQVLSTPGLHLSKLSASPAIIRSAQSVGLIQSATVQSATGEGSTYVFSPLLEAEDDQCTTTEAFHLRKLFVAHILFGHERARAGGGTIRSPVTLVNSLVNRGRVGPATNIGTDYHLLEMAGVVAVQPLGSGDRAYLKLVKSEVAQAGLDWIRRITDGDGTESLKLNQQPSRFITPETARTTDRDGASNEIMTSSINELRKELQRAARRDDPWS